MAEVGVQLPRWQSHKKVCGDKIVRAYGDASIPEPYVVWILDCGGRIEPSQETLNRVPEGVDATGGYYVLYEDGFASWSPAKAFEEGYSRLEGLL